jgi:hypothetical protein
MVGSVRKVDTREACNTCYWAHVCWFQPLATACDAIHAWCWLLGGGLVARERKSTAPIGCNACVLAASVANVLVDWVVT